MSEFSIRSIYERRYLNCRTFYTAIVICVCFSTQLFSQDVEEFTSLILEESKLRINGTSNVTDFECIYQDRVSSDSLTHFVTFGDSDSLLINGNEIHLESASLDCGKRPINRDMMKTLKADEFPTIGLGLDAVEISDELPFELKIKVTLAGTRRSEIVEVNDFSFNDGVTMISGVSIVDLRDYDLKTPSPLFGLIKVDDKVEIVFTFKISTIKKG